MTTPPDEPGQSKALVRLANALGLSRMAALSLIPDQQEHHQKTIAAMQLMMQNHLHALASYDAFRRQLLDMANQAKAEDPVGAEFIDDFVTQSLADYSDELKLLVATQNRRHSEAALAEQESVIVTKEVTPLSAAERWGRRYDIQRNIFGLLRKTFGLCLLGIAIVIAFMLLVYYSLVVFIVALLPLGFMGILGLVFILD